MDYQESPQRTHELWRYLLHGLTRIRFEESWNHNHIDIRLPVGELPNLLHLSTQRAGSPFEFCNFLHTILPAENKTGNRIRFHDRCLGR